MKSHLSIEKRVNLLQKKLDEDLQIEDSLKLKINQEFEELKHLEVSLERLSEQKHTTYLLRVKH
jgi:hypothetical protein